MGKEEGWRGVREVVVVAAVVVVGALDSMLELRDLAISELSHPECSPTPQVQR